MSRSQHDRLNEYVRQLFAPESPALASIPERQRAEGLPAINVSPDEGKLLAVLLHAVGARRVLEIGTLGGYSGVWMAAALPSTGRLVTIEKDPHHAAVARRAFEEAGVADRVEQRQGVARDILPTLAPGFDVVFIDADKESQPFYYDEGLRLLRVGGLLLCDNAFLDGDVLKAKSREARVVAVREFNRRGAADPRLSSTIVPVRDGLFVGVKLGD